MNVETTNQMKSKDLPRIFIFFVQLIDIVPRIVWPEWYVFFSLSNTILSFSIFSSAEGDFDWSDGGSGTWAAPLLLEFFSELWSILQ